MEALALIEFSSIAAGTRAVDALIKKAPVNIERVGTLQPGKMAVLFSGEVASVEASHSEALRVAGNGTLDELLLPLVHPNVYRATLGHRAAWEGDTIGVIEATTLAATVAAADAAVKGANVVVTEIRLGDELGGKGLAHFAGAQHDVEAAVQLGLQRGAGPGRKLHSSITPRFDDGLRSNLGVSTRFWGDG